MKAFYEITQKHQIERWENVLRVLRALTPHQRRKHWDMGSFGQRTDCGTVACAAGHCGLDPWFTRRGFKMIFRPDLYPYDGSTTNFGNNGSPVREFFGSGAGRIFFNGNSRTVGKVIKEVLAHIKTLTAKREE